MGQCSSLIAEDIDKNPDFQSKIRVDSSTVVFSSFFPYELLADIENVLNGATWKYGWRSNQGLGYAHWNYNLVPNAPYSGRQNGIDISGYLIGPIARAWKWIGAHIAPKYILTRAYANGHTYGVEGYPHTDAVRKEDKTIVVYMNKEWKREWGGETIIYGEGSDIELAQLPVYNRAIMFDGFKWHCARGVTRICPALRLTVVFKLAPICCDDLRDRIQRYLIGLGVFDKKHTSNGSLGCHLLGVYDLLHLTSADLDICAAGGLHSIFGTNHFQDITVEKTRRSEVVKIVGEKAVQIIELFSSIKRPTTLETALSSRMSGDIDNNSIKVGLDLNGGGVVSVNADMFKALIVIEAANLIDQKRMLESNFPKILAFWRKFQSHGSYG